MLLESLIIAYNVLEGVFSVAAGIAASSVVLIGFGLDSGIEVSAALVVLWHLSRSGVEQQPSWEARVARFVGLTLLLMAAYVFGRSIFNLVTVSKPEESYLGIVITATSVVIMPLVSRLQYRYARRIDSIASQPTPARRWSAPNLSVAALLGLGANALLGWWWADPVAGLVLVVLIAREGWEIYSHGELLCVDD